MLINLLKFAYKFFLRYSLVYLYMKNSFCITCSDTDLFRSAGHSRHNLRSKVVHSKM